MTIGIENQTLDNNNTGSTKTKKGTLTTELIINNVTTEDVSIKA